MDPDFSAERDSAAYRLAWGRRSVPVRRIWRGGLALGHAEARHLPGLVHLLRGARHVATGLIVSEEVGAEEHRFAFKRLTFCATAPAQDWAPDPTAPTGPSTPDRVGL